jgi:hypothetical protein
MKIGGLGGGTKKLKILFSRRPWARLKNNISLQSYKRDDWVL